VTRRRLTGSRLLVTVRGELGYPHVVGGLDGELAAACHLGGDVELDLSGVGFIDAAGVAALWRLREALTVQGRAFRVVATSPIAHEVLEIIGFRAAISETDPLSSR
jgi:anti-anti-sigma factor